MGRSAVADALVQTAVVHCTTPWERAYGRLVAMGAALFVLVPQTAGADEAALSRVVQGVVAGIGFLGAGTILKGDGKSSSHVKGLTTSAGLWMTAAIGVCAGMGREATALLSTLFALIILGVMPWVVNRFEDKDEPDEPEHPR
ncbi:MgtC/SapB family protein [Pseudomonas sp. R5(2019)]|nr:MgtC/SapB family protein [Pseudomonas sp. R5(2019)]